MENNNGQEENPIITAIISREFCVPQEFHLKITRKLLAVTDGNFAVTDEDGKVIFKVKEKIFTIHDRHILLDAGGTPIVTFKKKSLSLHKRWEVFRGQSSEFADLIFTAKKSSILQFKTELDVFLSGNEEESMWDFKVIGSWFKRSCIIYGKDSTPIAEMHKKHTLGSIVLGKDTFAVTVYPQVDYAFIVALVVILHEINKDEDD